MKDRKRLAVIAGGISFKGYQHLMLEGIISQAYALNYDVAVFSAFISFDFDTPYQKGEHRIYDLIPFDQFDAVIYAPCSYYTDLQRQIVERYIDTRCHVPVIALESDDPRYHCIPMDDFHAFGRVVDHLIEHHHLQKIYCLTGFKDNLQAEERQRGYRDSMQRHGLPVGDDWVIYGDFWKMKATEVAEDLAAGRMERPEAICCCCDTVALTLTNHLIELGIRVPEDIIVVSYDASTDAAINVPSITTYARPIKDMGMHAVLKAHELLTGETASPCCIDMGHIVTAESCGCGKDFFLHFEEHQKELRDTEEMRKLFDNTPMAESLNATLTLHDLLHQITAHRYLIKDAKEFYLCLCDNWDDLSKNTENPSDYNQYTPTMHLRITQEHENAEIVDQAFALEQLLPALHEDREHPRAYYFTPLHFNERCLGYCVLSYGDQPLAYDALYQQWSRNVSNALEFIRIRNNFASINQQLFMSSIRDPLTGIYNRQGFLHYVQDVYARALQPGMKLLIIAADLDRLKYINDTFGHLEGDNAISVAATALNTCSTYGEICARTGGDEYLIIGAAGYHESTPKRYIAYVEEFLDRYNAVSGKPYEVGVSLGYICKEVHEGEPLQAFLDEADALMYENKAMRKKNRLS